MQLVRFFAAPVIVSGIALVAVWLYGGFQAFLTAALLSVLEVTLSFDNAVVNARVLRTMSARWQHRFVTWGMAFAVIGTRLILPILIVSVATFASPVAIAYLAAFSPMDYAALLHDVHHEINAFGAVFLALVALKYFLDHNKTVHWIRVVERQVARWGSIESLEIALALVALALISFIVPAAEAASILVAGIVGIVVFILMEGITGAFSLEAKDTATHGLTLFIYLNVLDTAFSLDSVVGAFALTTAIPVIVVGLGIGAYFVRELTLYMVREHTLDTLKYLEHGAHWAILGLAASMFVSLTTEVPEIITGSIGLFFVVTAYWSSVIARRRG